MGEITEDVLPGFIRRIYCSEYRVACPSSPDYGNEAIPHWDGGVDSFGRNHRPVWPRLATFFTQHQIDPIVYIQAAFALRRGRTPPAPNTLMHGDLLSHYYQVTAERRTAVSEAWLRNRKAIENEIWALKRFYPNHPESAVRVTAICDTHRIEAGPLLRYCMAVEFGLMELAGDFLRPAAVEYLCNRVGYDALLPDLPQPIRDAAAAVQREMTNPKG